MAATAKPASPIGQIEDARSFIARWLPLSRNVPPAYNTRLQFQPPNYPVTAAGPKPPPLARPIAGALHCRDNPALESPFFSAPMRYTSMNSLMRRSIGSLLTVCLITPLLLSAQAA